MSDLSATFAAGIDIPLKWKEIVDGVEVEKEKTYHMSPLTHGDLAEFETFLQTKYMDLVKKHTADLPTDERRALLSQALEKVAQITIASEECARTMTTLEGITQLSLIAFRKSHPDITMEELGRIMIDTSAAKLVMDRIAWLNRGHSPQNPTQAPQILHKRGKGKKRKPK